MPNINQRVEFLEKTKGLSVKEIEKLVKKEVEEAINKFKEETEERLEERNKLFFEIFKDIKRVFENEIGGVSLYPEFNKKIDKYNSNHK